MFVSKTTYSEPVYLLPIISHTSQKLFIAKTDAHMIFLCLPCSICSSQQFAKTRWPTRHKYIQQYPEKRVNQCKTVVLCKYGAISNFPPVYII